FLGAFDTGMIHQADMGATAASSPATAAAATSSPYSSRDGSNALPSVDHKAARLRPDAAKSETVVGHDADGDTVALFEADGVADNAVIRRTQQWDVQYASR
ncbi:hypothetical protein LTR66_013142, partial [Elasticomyces elasticus]